MTSDPDPPKSDDTQKPSDGEDEFLGMDPGAFDSVDDLFADPSMVEAGASDAVGDDKADENDKADDDDDDESEESDLLSV